MLSIRMSAVTTIIIMKIIVNLCIIFSYAIQCEGEPFEYIYANYVSGWKKEKGFFLFKL